MYQKEKMLLYLFGSLDFKFRNDLGKDIRIEATTDNQTIHIRLVQL